MYTYVYTYVYRTAIAHNEETYKIHIVLHLGDEFEFENTFGLYVGSGKIPNSKVFRFWLLRRN